jgi:2-desacetyl-2-hydroxyethyl bacteriochlorophyllide A dehydrogenase
MKALCISAPGQASVTDLALPAIGPQEVLIRSHAVGICGSDVELYRGTRPEGFYRYPVIPGHEWSGEIVEVGDAVRTLVPGQKVVVEGILSCGSCENCRMGLTNLCEAGYDEIGFTRPGGLAEYVAVPARQVHVLPDNASLEEAALLEPAAVVAHAFLRVSPQAGCSVAVIGDGTIGQLAVQMARLFSPAEILVLGSRENRLELARQLGATRTVNLGYEDPLPVARALSRGRGMDLVFEGGSRSSGVKLALDLARRGGTVLLEGIAGAAAQLNLESDVFVLKHLSVQGIFGAHTAAWTYTVQLFRSGCLNLAPLITHRFALSDYQTALNVLADRQGHTLKVLLLHQLGERNI